MIKAAVATEIAYNNFHVDINNYIEENRELLNQQLDLAYNAVKTAATLGKFEIDVDLIKLERTFSDLINHKLTDLGYRIYFHNINNFRIYWG